MVQRHSVGTHYSDQHSPRKEATQRHHQRDENDELLCQSCWKYMCHPTDQVKENCIPCPEQETTICRKEELQKLPKKSTTLMQSKK